MRHYSKWTNLNQKIRKYNDGDVFTMSPDTCLPCIRSLQAIRPYHPSALQNAPSSPNSIHLFQGNYICN